MLNILTNKLTLALLVFCLLGCGGTQASPSENVTKSAGSESSGIGSDGGHAQSDSNIRQVVRRFWEILINNDLDSMDEVIGFPFTWDSECRIFENIEQVHVRIADEGLQKGNITIGKVQELRDQNERGKRVKYSLEKLATDEGHCDEMTNQLVSKASSVERRYFFVELNVVEVDSRKSWAVTRVSLINGQWKVTGFDN